MSVTASSTTLAQLLQLPTSDVASELSAVAEFDDRAAVPVCGRGGVDSGDHLANRFGGVLDVRDSEVDVFGEYPPQRTADRDA